MVNTTILYLTDNTVETRLADVVRCRLRDAAGELPIVSISHEPLDFGRNICVGMQPRCFMTIYKQMIAGAKAAETEYIAIAEHDVIYAPEHFNQIPMSHRDSLDDIFYYDSNIVLCQYGGWQHGEYTEPVREWISFSQMACHKDLLIETASERLKWMEQGYKFIAKGGSGEFGVLDILVSPKGEQLQLKKPKTITWCSSGFPTLDLKRDDGYIGRIRGKNPTYIHSCWGDLDDVLGFTQQRLCVPAGTGSS